MSTTKGSPDSTMATGPSTRDVSARAMPATGGAQSWPETSSTVSSTVTQPVSTRSTGTYAADDGYDVPSEGGLSTAAGPRVSSYDDDRQQDAVERRVDPGRARRVRLTVARVDPWSAMKMSFLLSVALGIALVVMTFVMWTILNGMGVFDKIDGVLEQLRGANSSSTPFSVRDFVGLGRVLSLSVVVAVIDVVLMTAIATLGAFLYNVSATLVGGIQLTLTDD